MARVSTATTLSNGVYTGGMAWKAAGGARDGESFELPADAYWLTGHDGQSIAVVPSEQLVVVRLGLTPSKLQYRAARLLEKVVVAAREPGPQLYFLRECHRGCLQLAGTRKQSWYVIQSEGYGNDRKGRPLLGQP